jgi:uncharacterized protein YdaU (DUF1376 family)
MDYWKHRPDEWLRDRELNELTPEQFYGYFWLRQEAYDAKPPGILPASDHKLQKMSRLSVAGWRRCREIILAFFIAHSDGTWHHEAIKAEYLDFCQLAHKSKIDGYNNAVARYRRQNPRYQPAKPPVFEDPYAISLVAPHGPPMGALRGATDKNPVSDSPLAPHGTPWPAMAPHANSFIHGMNSNGGPAAVSGRPAAAPNGDHPPPPTTTNSAYHPPPKPPPDPPPKATPLDAAALAERRALLNQQFAALENLERPHADGRSAGESATS